MRSYLKLMQQQDLFVLAMQFHQALDFKTALASYLVSLVPKPRVNWNRLQSMIFHSSNACLIRTSHTLSLNKSRVRGCIQQEPELFRLGSGFPSSGSVSRDPRSGLKEFKFP